MVDSTNLRVMADNIRTLSAGTQANATAISEIESNLIAIGEVRHDYTVTAGGLASWNPTADPNFAKEGYTALGVIGFTNSSNDTYLINMAAIDNNYGFYLKNLSEASVTAYVKYYVLYVKTVETPGT